VIWYESHSSAGNETLREFTTARGDHGWQKTKEAKNRQFRFGMQRRRRCCRLKTWTES